MIVAIYVSMLLFDITVLAGFLYLISEKGWSAWWLLAAYVFMMGSNPENFRKALSQPKEKE